MAANPSTNFNKKKGETISELAHRHLTDQGHTTSDEELKNARLELTGDVEIDPENLYTVDNEPVVGPLAREDESVNKEKNTGKGGNKDGQGDLPNPYAVLK